MYSGDRSSRSMQNRDAVRLVGRDRDGNPCSQPYGGAFERIMQRTASCQIGNGVARPGFQPDRGYLRVEASSVREKMRRRRAGHPGPWREGSARPALPGFGDGRRRPKRIESRGFPAAGSAGRSRIDSAARWADAIVSDKGKRPGRTARMNASRSAEGTMGRPSDGLAPRLPRESVRAATETESRPVPKQSEAGPGRDSLRSLLVLPLQGCAVGRR
jgi:hypothetical protein